MNEEDSERDRADNALPSCRRRVPPCYVPEGDSPLSGEEKGLCTANAANTVNWGLGSGVCVECLFLRTPGSSPTSQWG